ncbi:hypothetical protein MNBD_GAMMA07-2573 [hydrothermal vent metagenome]|uniref:Uncharacterized protein n=1 Tax=hydrothermal vent metagenome TaxID=652676 RepID=A0A3B0WM36_9ZZZZ
MINSHQNLPEIVFSSANTVESKRISRLKSAGRLIKIAPKIYTSNLKSSPESVIRHHWHKIISHLFPGAILSHRTALNHGDIIDNTIFLTYRYAKKINLPGLTVRLLKGDMEVGHEAQLPDINLLVSSTPRYLLENLSLSRSKKTISKSAGFEVISKQVELLVSRKKDIMIKILLDEAKDAATKMRLIPEYEQLKLIVKAAYQQRRKIMLNQWAGEIPANRKSIDKLVDIDSFEFNVNRFWSSPKFLPLGNVIGVVLNAPTHDDLAILCDRFGVKVVKYVLSILKKDNALQLEQVHFTHQFLSGYKHAKAA